MVWINYKVPFWTFWFGIKENWDEYQVWKATRADFLVPTFFTMAGIVNIQQRSVGEYLTREEFLSVWKCFYLVTGKDLWETFYHTLANQKNYHRMADGSLKLLDCGGIRSFIIKWQKLFKNVFIDNFRV